MAASLKDFGVSKVVRFKTCLFCGGWIEVSDIKDRCLCSDCRKMISHNSTLSRAFGVPYEKNER